MTEYVQQAQTAAEAEWKEYLLDIKNSNKNLNGMIVCIDNGHGEATKGKASPYTLYNIEPKISLKEYEFNRKVAKKTKELLEAMGAIVYMVCPETEGDISLTARANRANKLKANYKYNNKPGNFVFISIHGNAYGKGDQWYPGVNGWSVWTTKGQNNSDIFATCLWEAAEDILKPMGKKIRKDMSDKDPDYESDFTIILKANMPAALTENFFYTDPDDCRFMNSENGINALAKVHAEGVARFAKKKFNIG